MSKLYLYSDILGNLTKLLGTGVLPDERILAAAEFADLTRMQPAVLADGRKLENLVVHDVVPQAFFRQGMADYPHIVQAGLLEGFLTNEEIDLLNKNASESLRRKGDQERFEKAEKISEDEYSGPVSDGYDHWDSIEEFIEEKQGSDCPIPDYIWGCDVTETCLSVCADSILEGAMDNISDDFSYRDLNGIEEFRAAVDSLLAANKGWTTWDPNYGLAIILNKRVDSEENL